MRWGLIGARGLAARGCVPAFVQSAEADLVAVLSSDERRARAFAAEHGIPTATGDLEELLSAPGLEAVWIASPTFLHHRQVKAALQAGRHVLVEKPLAMNAAEGWELVELARGAGVLLAVGYQARYVPAFLEMRRLVAEGAIGRVSVLRTYYGVHRPGPPPRWRQCTESAHWGALADIGTHHVD
ncbi:MAG: Gfo/Idh/MocA family protein, partial [Trebonia sp.]